jgi:RHS repeat-associated protein
VARRYVFGPGADEPLVWYEGSGTGDRRFLHADERGSIVAVSNGAGTVTNVNTYDEYGTPGTGNAGRFQYTGQAWINEIGLYYYKNRFYSAGLGRFLQTDPIGYGDGLNMYGYGRGDPVNFTDPLGLEAGPCDPKENCGDIVVTARRVQEEAEDNGLTGAAGLTSVSEPTGAIVVTGGRVAQPRPKKSAPQARPPIDFCESALYKLGEMFEDLSGVAEPFGALTAFMGLALDEPDTFETGMFILAASGAGDFTGSLFKYAAGDRGAFRQMITNVMSKATLSFVIPRSMRNHIADELFAKRPALHQPLRHFRFLYQQVHLSKKNRNEAHSLHPNRSNTTCKLYWRKAIPRYFYYYSSAVQRDVLPHRRGGSRG